MLAIKIWMTSSTMMVLMAMTPIAAAASARELQKLDSRLEASASQSLCEASEEKAEALSLSNKKKYRITFTLFGQQ